MLLLLFTAPSENWDWCLCETDLYTRYDKTDVRAVVCLFNPGHGTPGPLSDLQGVPAEPGKIRALLDNFCRKIWAVSDDWRRGALAADIEQEKLKEVAEGG